MAQLTEKEFRNLANEFHAYVKREEIVGHSIKRAVLKSKYWLSFCENHGGKKSGFPSFAKTFYALRLFDLVEIVSKGRESEVIVKEMVSESVETELLKELRAKKEKQSNKGKAKQSKKRKKRKSAKNVVHHGDHAGKSVGTLGVVLSLAKPAFTDAANDRVEFVRSIPNVSSVGKKDSMMSFTIRNTSNNLLVVKRCEVLTKRSEFALSGSVRSVKEKTLIPGEEVSLNIRCLHNWRQVGTCTSELLLEIEGGESEEKNVTQSVYFVRFEKKDDIVTKHAPKEPYQKAKMARQRRYGAVVPGKRPPPLGNDRLERKVRLAEYKLPGNVLNAVKSGVFLPDNQDENDSFKNLKDTLEADLTFGNYRSKFDLLLYLEEIQNSQDILRYSKTGVKMTKQGNMMYLKVLGLAEKRPSVLRGDRIYVTIEGEAEQPRGQTQYEGYVHIVELERVGLVFSNHLHSQHTRKTLYNVRFTFNRLPTRLSHRAVNMKLPKILLFPQKCNTLYSDIKIVGADLSNRKIEDNKEQLQAVNNIVRGKESSVPYIIFGPPGTGKTVTMVEAIHQVIKIYEGCHILVCAPSNSACDHLTRLLLEHVRYENVLRMHAASRNWRDVSDDVRRVSNFANGDFYFPPKKDLFDYEIIICTLVTAGRLANAKFPDDHFTHIFIDEAGQATEPECMVGLGGILCQGGQVVLAGDPKQLGPIVMSSAAKQYGLGVSYLERVMDTMPLYQKSSESLVYDPQYITKLLKNYRSHKSILKVPNESFYDNELLYAATITSVSKKITEWSHLPQPGFPVVFEGVGGEDLRESTSPSFYNAHEISVVLDYVTKLQEFGIANRTIGIISPYQKQVQKIRAEISNRDIKVGSVEEFQGQERDVIIISTVRSDAKHLTFDAQHNLGFLSDPKRFNVAVTRSKMLLIVIGNPNILCLNYYWRALFEYCDKNNAYRGIAFQQTEQRRQELLEIEGVISGMEKVSISDDDTDVTDSSDDEYYSYSDDDID